MVIQNIITYEDKLKSNCNFDDFIFSPFDSDDDSFEIFDQRINTVEYTYNPRYRSSFVDSKEFLQRTITRPEQLDDLDQLLKLYEPCQPDCIPHKKTYFKNNNSVWKRFLFLFRKSKK